MSAWQPIETAPKDGEDILVWGFLLGMQVAYFEELEGRPCWIVFDVPRPYHENAFSFWQPLPAPPDPEAAT